MIKDVEVCWNMTSMKVLILASVDVWRGGEERKEDMEMRYREFCESLPLFVDGCEQGRK